ncbi:Uncharacterized protein Rs2_32454 [Raphanus sativus]|nr:Uncharacterized protein Rs2_32454 [Raphanus sativus]
MIGKFREDDREKRLRGRGGRVCTVSSDWEKRSFRSAGTGVFETTLGFFSGTSRSDSSSPSKKTLLYPRNLTVITADAQYDTHKQVIIINTHLLSPHDSALSMVSVLEAQLIIFVALKMLHDAFMKPLRLKNSRCCQEFGVYWLIHIYLFGVSVVLGDVVFCLFECSLCD